MSYEEQPKWPTYSLRPNEIGAPADNAEQQTIQDMATANNSTMMESKLGPHQGLENEAEPILLSTNVANKRTKIPSAVRWIAGAALAALPAGVATGYFGWQAEANDELERSMEYRTCAALLAENKVPTHERIVISEIPMQVQEQCGVIETLEMMSTYTKNPVTNSRFPDQMGGEILAAGNNQILVTLPSPDEFIETANWLESNANNPSNDIGLPILGGFVGLAISPVLAGAAYCMYVAGKAE